MGQKTNIDGDYVNLDMPSRKREAEAAIALQRQISESRKSIEQLIQLDNGSDDTVSADNSDEESVAQGNSFGQDFVR